MRALKSICVAAILVLSVTACNKNKRFQEEFVTENDEISVTVKGEDVFVYDSKTHQLGYNASRQEFRAVSDDLDEYCIVTLDKLPGAEGSEVSGSIMYKTAAGTVQKDALTFKVIKVDERQGMYWIWNKKNKTGAVVRKI